VAPPALAHRLPLRVYTVADGLARDSVRCIVEDSRGFLWLGTDEGLSRFDGAEFRNYDEKDGLAGPSVRAVLEEDDGTYWVGTNAGLFRFDPRPRPGRPLFERVALPTDPPPPAPGAPPSDRSTEVLAIVLHRDPAGRLWVGSTRGAAWLERDALGSWRATRVAFVDERGEPLEVVVRGFADDSRGGVLIGTRWWGVFHTTPPGGGEVPAGSHPATRWITHDEMGGDVRALLRDRAGRLWAASVSGLIELRPDAAAERLRRGAVYTREDGLPDSSVQALAEAADGRLLLATDAGAAIVERAGGPDARVTAIDRSDGLPPGIQASVAADAAGNLWLGSAGAGLARIAPHGLSTYDAADGLALERSVGALLDADGRPCFVTRSAALRVIVSCFDGERFEAVRVPFPPEVRELGWGVVRPVIATTRGWWFATERGVAHFPGDGRLRSLAAAGRPRLLGMSDGLPGRDVVALFEARDGTIWTSAGIETPGASTLCYLPPGAHRFVNVPAQEAIPDGFALDFAEDREGRLWVAFSGRLVRGREGRFERVADEAALGLLPELLHADAAGRLWVLGTGGVVRLDDPAAAKPAWTDLGPGQELASIDVGCAATDARGRLAIGTARGVDVLDPASGRRRHLGRDDGLAGNQVRHCLTDPQGNVWFAVDGAVSRLPPGDDPPARPPRILVGAVRVAGSPWPISELGQPVVDEVVLQPGQRQLAIDLVGFGSAPGGPPRFQHRLLGAGDDAWSAPQRERTVALAGLAPGRYRFEARAVDGARQVSAEVASVGVVVLAPLWQRPWFWAALALAAAGAGALALRARARRALQLERLRTRIAMDLHDELGSGLGGIGIMAGLLGEEELPPEERRGLAQRVAATAGELGFALTDIVWALRPGNTRLERLAYFLAERGGRLFAGERTRFETAFPDAFPDLELTLAAQHAVQRVGLEALHNAAKYAGAGRVTLTLAPAAGGRWMLAIEDDGVGIADAGRVAAAEDDAAPHGHGLPGMRRRAAEIGAELTVGPGAGGRGTRVALTFDPAGGPA
jgi:ligand-binding sensor domain-containing protein/signal transduction histidine kinase